MKLIKKLLKLAVLAYIILFTVFYFDLDSKMIYRYVMPWLNDHYEKLPHKDITLQPYTTKVDSII